MLKSKMRRELYTEIQTLFYNMKDLDWLNYKLEIKELILSLLNKNYKSAEVVIERVDNEIQDRKSYNLKSCSSLNFDQELIDYYFKVNNVLKNAINKFTKDEVIDLAYSILFQASILTRKLGYVLINENKINNQISILIISELISHIQDDIHNIPYTIKELPNSPIELEQLKVYIIDFIVTILFVNRNFSSYLNSGLYLEFIEAHFIDKMGIGSIDDELL